MEAIPVDADVPPREATAPTAAPIHQFWWLHDARWYQGVLKRYGQDAANEINAEAVKFVARRVAAWHSRSQPPGHGAPTAEKMAEHTAELLRLMGSDSGSEVTQHILGEDEWETVVTKSLSLRMLRAAGTLDGYDCPCLELRAGWFEGLRVPVQDSCVACQRAGADACRFRARIERDATEKD